MDGYMGEIRLFGGNFAPKFWAFCEGQLLNIAEYSALYSILGTYYGGDGRSTFGLPDLRGRAPIGVGVGMGLSPIYQGQFGGSEREVLNASQMPVHAHVAQSELQAHLMAANKAGEEASPSGNSLARPSEGEIYSDEDASVAMNDDTVSTLARKLAFADNDVRWGKLMRYGTERLRARLPF